MKVKAFFKQKSCKLFISLSKVWNFQKESLPLFLRYSWIEKEKYTMKKFLLYILRCYFWSVIAIALATWIYTTIRYYCDSSYDRNSFSTPAFATLACGIIWPILNMPVVIALYKYQLNKLEVIIESICFVFISSYMKDIIRLFVSPNLLWIHKNVDGIKSFGRVWWYEETLLLIYGICITILLCLLYVKIKKLIIKRQKKVQLY